MKKFLFLFVAAFCSLLLVGQVFAISLSLNPAYQEIPLNGIASLNLDIDGLTEGGPDSLGAFWINVDYDSSILAFDSLVFGSFLGDPDPLNFETDSDVDTSTLGLIDFYEMSFLFDWELDALQGSSFTLATLNFKGIALGYSPVDLSFVDLSDAFGFTLDASTISNAGVDVVPEPSTYLLTYLLTSLARFSWNGRN